MNPILWYKNFNMVIELDVAGEFIYNGFQEIYQTPCLNNDANTFVALYNIAVGIERLQKIVIVLWEDNNTFRDEKFDTRLKRLRHNHISLRDKIDDLLNKSNYENIPKFSNRENDFLELLNQFYKSIRYMRYGVDKQTDKEVTLLNNFLDKYIEVDRNYLTDSILVSDKTKKLLGKVISKISKDYYKLVREGSNRNGIFTYEIREDSKAAKVFRSQSLYNEMFDERISFKELMVYIRNTNEKHPFLKFVEDIKPLSFDPGLINGYFEELINGIISQQLIDEVDYLYDNLDNKKERQNTVDLLGNPNVDFEYPHIKKCKELIDEIINTKSISDEQISIIKHEKEYILEDEVIEMLNKFEIEFRKYKEGLIDSKLFIQRISEINNDMDIYW